MLILLLLILPIIATLISVVIKNNQKIVELFSIVSVTLQLGISLLIAHSVIQTGSYNFLPYLEIDSLGTLLILISSTIGLASVCYNIGYVRAEIQKGIIGISRGKQSYLLINLFLFSMFCAISATNPIITWISIEATTLSTVFLISFYNKPTAIEAAWKYLVINSVGLMLAFLGTIIYLVIAAPYMQTVFITWTDITSIASSLNPDVVKMAFIFVLIGYGTKVGLAPMHAWLPDAHSQAPSPISAVLSGALLNIALLPVLRFKIITDTVVGQGYTQSLFIFFGCLSIVLAAFSIFRQTDYKRLLAYSSIEHIAIVLLGFGFGGLGIYAGLLHMLYHSLGKSFMFLLSGNILLKYSSAKIINVQGMLKVLPKTSVLFLIGFLILTGVPPFGTFLTETYIILAGIETHLWITILVVFSLGLIFFGFLKNISSMLFSNAPEDIPTKEFSKWTLIPPVILLCLFTFLSLFLPQPLQTLLQSAANLFSK